MWNCSGSAICRRPRRTGPATFPSALSIAISWREPRGWRCWFCRARAPPTPRASGLRAPAISSCSISNGKRTDLTAQPSRSHSHSRSRATAARRMSVSSPACITFPRISGILHSSTTPTLRRRWPAQSWSPIIRAITTFSFQPSPAERELLATSSGIAIKTPRGEIQVMTPPAFHDHFAAEAPDAAGGARLAALRFAVRDIDATAKLLEQSGLPHARPHGPPHHRAAVRHGRDPGIRAHLNR